MAKPGIKIFAPASVANVAVGFDILGFALEKPGDETIIREGSKPGLFISEIQGAGGKLPYDIMKNTAGYAAYRLLEHIGETDRPLEMEIHKKMPFGSGLGSSAASAAGGVYAVNEFLHSGLSKQEILRVGVEGEQIADGYKGEIIQHLPYNIEEENVKPIYTEYKGWKADLTGLTTYDSLPKELNDYIEFIEKEVEVPIKIVSVGPDRKQTIMR